MSVLEKYMRNLLWLQLQLMLDSFGSAWIHRHWALPWALPCAGTAAPCAELASRQGEMSNISRPLQHFTHVKLGACSIFGNFCVGGSKEGIKKIPLAVKLRAHLGILFLESQEAFLAYWGVADFISRCQLSAYGTCQDYFFFLVERFLLECLMMLTTWSIMIWKLIPKIPQEQATSHGWKTRTVTAQAWRISHRGIDNELKALYFLVFIFPHWSLILFSSATVFFNAWRKYLTP